MDKLETYVNQKINNLDAMGILNPIQTAKLETYREILEEIARIRKEEFNKKLEEMKK